MKCPNCETEMEKGSLGNNGMRWVQPGKIATLLNISRGEKVIAWKCPKCNKVDLVTE